MSEDSSVSDTTETTTSGEVQETQTQTVKDSVSYESHRKLLSEKKKFQAELEQTRSQLDELLTEKNMSEGKKDEVIESLKKRSSSAEEKFNKAVSYFADRTVKGALREEAIKAGCINVDDFIKLTDMSLIEVTDDFEVDIEQVRTVVADAKKNRDYLFSAKTPSVKVGTPNSKVETTQDWKKLSPVEQAKLAFTMDKKN